MKIINTKRNIPIFVDDDKYEFLSKFGWGINGRGYVIAMIQGKNVRMHRLLLGLTTKDSLHVDHINGIKTDNRLINLRVCTPSQNQYNRKVSPKNELGAKCVRKRYNGKYQVGVQVDGKRYWLGTFETIEEAIIIREQFAKENHGEFFR
jgi:hypothetical protein